jgi:hypothetical protein
MKLLVVTRPEIEENIMGLLKILEGTTLAQVEVLNEKRKTAGLTFLQGPGNRRRGARFDAAGGRRGSDDVLAEEPAHRERRQKHG